MIAYLIVLLKFCWSIEGLSVPPTWVTSSYVKAGSFMVTTNVKISSGTTMTVTSTFAAPAFTTVPHLAYGIQKYEGTILLNDRK